MATNPTVGFPGGTDKTFKTVQLSPAAQAAFAQTVLPVPPYLPNRFYATWPGPTSSAAVASADVLYLYPFYLSYPMTVINGIMRIATGGAASAVKAAIWANSVLNNLPVGAPVLADNTGVATTSSGTQAIVAFAGTLPAGFYWMGSKFQATLPTMVMQGNGNLLAVAMMGLPNTNANSGALLANGLSVASSYANAHPTFAEATTFTNLISGAPLVSLAT